MLDSELNDRESNDNPAAGCGAGELNPGVPAAVFQPPQVLFQPPTARSEPGRPEPNSPGQAGEASAPAEGSAALLV